MADRDKIQTVAEIALLTQREQLELALTLEIADALGGGGGATIQDIVDAIIAQGTVTLSTEGTALTIEANLDEVEELQEAIRYALGLPVNASGQGESFTPASTTFTPGLVGAPDIVSIADATIDLREGAYKGASLRITGSSSNNIIVDIDDVAAQFITIPNGLLTTENGSAGVTLQILGFRDPDSINSRLADILAANSAQAPTEPTPQSETDPTAAGGPYDHDFDVSLGGTASFLLNNETNQTITYEVFGALEATFIDDGESLATGTLLTTEADIRRINLIQDYFTHIRIQYTVGVDATGDLTTTPKFVKRGE